ncbi:ABC transporter substrate-binding protein [Microbacterium sp. SMR1]|uniref:ABC transporter substrate-binding protein n=1 Tax=Microbacterium sp. SMR1 TaxID=1497340 RepID=UPI000DCD8939|nr:extracellular solute-binding protein [Microbacterium sp. SMR1]RAZ32875.1 ABC transporter substrate-binding protein [Microbacterium sp. SMR1]
MMSTRMRRRVLTTAATGFAVAVTLSACAPPSAAPAGEGAASGGPIQTTCGTDDVTLDAYVETGFPVFSDLATEFEKQFPNVTVNLREDQFAVITQNAPRVLVDSPPDIMRLPTIVDLVDSDLLYDLDPYAEAYGWDQWPSSQLEQLRVDENGQRGDGPLYGMGINYSVTGVFYNKTLAAQAGMTEPPATLAELDGYLQAAKDAGLTPVAQFNGGATGGLAFPLQALMASYGEPSKINDWIFLKDDATIDTPENLEAAEHLKGWIDAGYFAPDINSMDYSQMMSRFIGGESVFIFNGDWESGNLDAQMPDNVGFFLMPPVEAGGQVGAMSAPTTYGVSAYADEPDCAAFFFDWVATNETARTIAVESGGSHPMGPADAFMPEIAEGSVTAETLAAGADLSANNGSMDFIANATGSIYAKTLTPNLQELFAGKQTADGLLTKVQSDYLSQKKE